MPRTSKSAFTLIELLITLGIVAVLSTVVVVTLNPAELLRQAKDSTRTSDLNSLNTALGTYTADVREGITGVSSTVYISIPDSSPTCENLGLPSLPSGWTYSCAAEENYRKIDGTGWIPANLEQISFGNPLVQLPIDPKNSTSTGLYYTYVTAGSHWELTSILESEKYGPRMVVDGGMSPNAFERGTDLTLTPAEALDRGIIAGEPEPSPAPSISSISPTSTTVGASEFILTIIGSSFTSSSTVKWEGSDRATTFVSDTQLAAIIFAGDISATGTIAITVSDPIGGDSGSSNFAIEERPVFVAGAWTTDSTGGVTQGAGASLAEVGGNYYVLVGGTTFQKYNPSANLWVTLAPVPASIGDGASIAKYNNDTLFVMRGNSASGFYKYTISTDTWSAMANCPANISFGGSLTYPGSGDYLYGTSGGYTTNFWRYSVSNNSWGESGVSNSEGSGIVEVNGIFYILRGYFNGFNKYDPSTESWTNLANISSWVASGGAIVKYSDNILFVMAGYNDDKFYKYTISTNTWSAMDNTPAPVSGGGALVYPGSGDYVYAFQGGNTDAFWRYSVVENSWDTSLPVFPSTVGIGGALTSFDSNTLYAFRGGSSPNFYQYNISAGEWTSKADAPANVSGGGSLTTDGVNIYASRGHSLSFWKYNISLNSWSTLTSAPMEIGLGSTARGGIIYSPTLEKIYAITGLSPGTYCTIMTYDPSINAWTRPCRTPSSIGPGGSLTSLDSNNIYWFRGASANFYQYDIPTGTWTYKGNAPGSVTYGGSLTTDGTNLYATQGSSTAFWKYIPTINSWSSLVSTPEAIGSATSTRGGISYSSVLNAVFGISGNSGAIYKNSP